MKDKDRRKAARIAEAMRLVKILRTQMNDAITGFNSRINADLVKILLLLPSSGSGKSGLNKKSIAYLIKKISALKLKPKKGRIKDLVRVHRIVEKTIRRIKTEKVAGNGGHRPAKKNGPSPDVSPSV